MDTPLEISPVEVWEEFVEFDGFKEALPGILPYSLEVGRRKDILVVTGENASGKSLAFMILSQVARNFAEQEGAKLEVMDIGMNRRTESGIVRGFIFGDENTDSTGNISMKVVQTAVSTSRNREGFHYLMLDEPDIGVGEGYHNAIGQFLGDYAAAIPEKCLGFVVATHSRRIASKLLDCGASSLRVGSDLRLVRDWVSDGDVEKTVDDLINLKSESLERFRAVSKMLGGR